MLIYYIIVMQVVNIQSYNSTLLLQFTAIHSHLIPEIKLTLT